MSISFTHSDFDVFLIEEFNERMEAIRGQVRPKLAALGEKFAPWLEEETGLSFYFHVASHARRTVNPPDETWVAFGRSLRGYKRYIHLTIAIDRSGLKTQAVVKPESDDKLLFGRALQNIGLDSFAGLVTGADIYIESKRTGNVPLYNLDESQFSSLTQSLLNTKSSDVAFNILLPRDQVVAWHPPQLMNELRNGLLKLIPIYSIPLELAAPTIP